MVVARALPTMMNMKREDTTTQARLVMNRIDMLARLRKTLPIFLAPTPTQTPQAPQAMANPPVTTPTGTSTWLHTGHTLDKISPVNKASKVNSVSRAKLVNMDNMDKQVNMVNMINMANTANSVNMVNAARLDDPERSPTKTP